MAHLSPTQEELRVAELQRYLTLDFDETQEFKDLVDLAAAIGRTPVALLTLLDKDKNWIMARSGIDLPPYMPRETSFCQYAIGGTDTLIIEDATKDERFEKNPLVYEPPNVRFYAGAPVTISGGVRLGNLCLFDLQPNKLDDFQKRALEILARQATYIMELQLGKKMLQEHLDEIEDKNKKFRQIAHIQSHEVRQPLTSIMGLINIIRDEGYTADKDQLHMLEEAAKQLDKKIHEIVAKATE